MHCNTFRKEWLSKEPANVKMYSFLTHLQTGEQTATVWLNSFLFLVIQFKIICKIHLNFCYNSNLWKMEIAALVFPCQTEQKSSLNNL